MTENWEELKFTNKERDQIRRLSCLCYNPTHNVTVKMTSFPVLLLSLSQNLNILHFFT